MVSQREDAGRERSGSRGVGLKIAPRFVVAMMIPLTLVLLVFSYLMLGATSEILETALDDARDEAAVALSQYQDGELPFIQPNTDAVRVVPGILRGRVTFTSENRSGEDGYAYFREAQTENKIVGVTAAAAVDDDPLAKLYGLVFALTMIVLMVAAAVAVGVANRVSQPITSLVDDVRAIANGNLTHRVRAQGGGEVALLAGAMDRMTDSLREARDAEMELSVREREREVALEVQEALRPTDIPVPEGYDVASEHVGSAEPGGDFHDFVEAEDGRLIFFACDVSGTGVPGALVGAMARAYLKTAFRQGGSLEDVLKGVNRVLAREVRRGMFVTVLAAALDQERHELEVVSAGHKLPLIHWSREENVIRAIQPDGIALGFDRGPVFERSISARQVPLAPGDRVALAGTGAVRVVSLKGEEIGEKRFYKLFLRNADEDTEVVLDGILTALEAFADEESFPADVSIIVLGRDPEGAA